jgi:hypothetical protein
MKKKGLMSGPHLNDPSYEVPENTIIVVPHALDNDGFYKEIVEPLKGNLKRDWFTSHFYYCLPLTIGNQYGFMIKSLIDFDAIWDGTESNPIITFIDNSNSNKQIIQTGFGSGIITIQNRFALKTPIGINLMTIQPPNMFIPGCVSMTGVIETDNIRRDFTFNLKVTVPNLKISIRKGDPLGAFLPIPRNFVEGFDLKFIQDLFPIEVHENEILESMNLSVERNTVDVDKPHQSGRRYFKGVHTSGEKYKDHQKKII